MLTSTRQRLLLLAAVSGLVVALALTGPAAADLGGKVDCDANPSDPRCTVVVVNPGGGGSGGDGGGSARCTQGGQVVPCDDPTWGWLGSDGCRYKPDPHPPAGSTPPAGSDPSTGGWYIRFCPAVGARDESVDSVWLAYRDVPVLGALLIRALAELRLPRPSIGISPAPPAPQVVFVPAWLWVDPALWHAYRATAAIPGLSLTATGMPVSVAWQTGDGATVTCGGPGRAWTPGMDAAAASPDCGHVYTSSSHGVVWTLTATITWRVTWAGGGAAGTEPALISTSSVAIRVSDASVVNTR